jgi:hypothetical protein
MLALAVASLSGCVTAKTLDHARTYTEYRTEQYGIVARQYVVGVCAPEAYRHIDHKDKTAYNAELARLEEAETIQPVGHTGKPGYYALVPPAVVADIALVPAYVVYAALHLK